MKTTAIILLINALYGVVGFLLYAERVQTHATILNSDAIVFLGPAVLAIILNSVTMLKAFPKHLWPWKRVTLAITCAFALTFATLWGYMLIGLNRYGS